MTFLGSKIFGDVARGIELGAGETDHVDPFWWLVVGSGFWMMFEFDGGLVGVGSNDTLPSSIRS